MQTVYHTPGSSFAPAASSSDAIRYPHVNVDYVNPGPASQVMSRAQWLQFSGGRPGVQYAAPSAPNSWSGTLPYELWSQVSANGSTAEQQAAQRIVLTSPPGQDGQAAATPYRIQDILAHGQVPLLSEVAKTPGFQEKSPTGTGATIYFDNRLSALTDPAQYRKDGQAFLADQPVYHTQIVPPTITSMRIMETTNAASQQPGLSVATSTTNVGPVLLLCIPSNYQTAASNTSLDTVFDPARQQHGQNPGVVAQTQFKPVEEPNAKSPTLKAGVAAQVPPGVEGESNLPKAIDIDKALEKGGAVPCSRRGRPTFSGVQIEELEKAFSTSQYLSTTDRHLLADRLNLQENQIKIWFQNRRTKCRRTAWKSRPSSSSNPPTPTTPNPPMTPTTPMTPGSVILSPTSLAPSLLASPTSAMIPSSTLSLGVPMATSEIPVTAVTE